MVCPIVIFVNPCASTINDIPFALKPLIYEIHNIYITTKKNISYKIVNNYIYNLHPNKMYFIVKNV